MNIVGLAFVLLQEQSPSSFIKMKRYSHVPIICDFLYSLSKTLALALCSYVNYQAMFFFSNQIYFISFNSSFIFTKVRNMSTVNSFLSGRRRSLHIIVNSSSTINTFSFGLPIIFSLEIRLILITFENGIDRLFTSNYFDENMSSVQTESFLSYKTTENEDSEYEFFPYIFSLERFDSIFLVALPYSIYSSLLLSSSDEEVPNSYLLSLISYFFLFIFIFIYSSCCLLKSASFYQSLISPCKRAFPFYNLTLVKPSALLSSPIDFFVFSFNTKELFSPVFMSIIIACNSMSVWFNKNQAQANVERVKDFYNRVLEDFMERVFKENRWYKANGGLDEHRIEELGKAIKSNLKKSEMLFQRCIGMKEGSSRIEDAIKNEAQPQKYTVLKVEHNEDNDNYLQARAPNHEDRDKQEEQYEDDLAGFEDAVEVPRRQDDKRKSEAQVKKEESDYNEGRQVKIEEDSESQVDKNELTIHQCEENLNCIILGRFQNTQAPLTRTPSSTNQRNKRLQSNQIMSLQNGLQEKLTSAQSVCKQTKWKKNKLEKIFPLSVDIPITDSIYIYKNLNNTEQSLQSTATAVSFPLFYIYSWFYLPSILLRSTPKMTDQISSQCIENFYYFCSLFS